MLNKELPNAWKSDNHLSIMMLLFQFVEHVTEKYLASNFDDYT
jgi:hypothetical protein